jgi:hypothetical protein
MNQKYEKLKTLLKELFSRSAEGATGPGEHWGQVLRYQFSEA